MTRGAYEKRKRQRRARDRSSMLFKYVQFMRKLNIPMPSRSVMDAARRVVEHYQAPPNDEAWAERVARQIVEGEKPTPPAPPAPEGETT